MQDEKTIQRIDDIDEEIMRLFSERMSLCAADSRARSEKGWSAYDTSGERAKLAHLASGAGDELRGYAGTLCSTLFELGRSYQDSLTRSASPLCGEIKGAVEKTPRLFPEGGLVACQGTEGAYSQAAAERIFEHPEIMFFRSFESVLSAVEKGLCRYGVLPLENSTAGSVNAVYDLMMKHRFSIVRSARIRVEHCLAAKHGAALSGVREIFSHEQAISQCAEYLASLPGVKVTAVENTAAAARMVAESGRADVAALCSRSCAEVYGLAALAEGVQDSKSNYTRFICVSKQLEIYPGADRTSVMLTIPHRPGSLYMVLSRINALNINLSKLESRPMPGREFEFMFYFDLDAPVESPRFAQLIDELDGLCESFQYLGSYSELV